MSATVVLDSQHKHFTNLDSLSGRVTLTLQNEAAISGIQVKLEGESRTRLSGPRNPQNIHSDKKRTELEVHKILYKVATVFPTAAVMQGGTPPAAYTFAAGSYEYPFQFKFPFNNACSPNSMLTNINFTGLKVEMARDSNRHVKKTLPPSLSGFPGEAEIRYFVKATIIRPQFYKENIRAVVPLNFLPIEPPRSGNPNEETYARRQYQFSKSNTKLQKGKNKKSIFSSRTSDQEDGGAPRVSVDARLPNPSILTCNEPIPLRLIAKKVSDSPDMVYLQMLQIELISYTKVTAHDLTRTESNAWVIMTRSNMNTALSKPGEKHGTSWTIDPSMWNKHPLPSSVAPSFETCNIERSYELEVRVGLAHGSPGNMKPQLIVLPLRMPVRVYSGIAPPQALLDAMAAAKGEPSPQLTQRPSWPIPQNEETRPAMPPRPTRPPVPAEAPSEYDDAPPSYEDAMADNLSPVDGPRREYHPPDASPLRTSVESGTDGKSSAEASRPPEGGPAPEGHITSGETQPPRERRSSSESFDMLPGSPTDSDSGNESSMRRHLSIMKIHRNTMHEDSPPQYEPVAETSPASSTPQPPRNNPRPMNLGVPSRKPVPGPRRPTLN